MLAVIRFFLGLLMLLIFASCENDISLVKKITNQQDAQIENAKGIEVIYSSNAAIKASLQAPTMKHFEGAQPYTELPEGVRMFFYDDSMKVNSQLTAGYGIRLDSKKQMVVHDNVEVINLNGEKLNTEELIWDEKTQRIYSNKFVKITRKDEILYGDGFESNADITNYKIKKLRGIIHQN